MKHIRTIPVYLMLTAMLLLAANPIETFTSRSSQWPPQGIHYSFGGPYEVKWKVVPTTLTDWDTQDIRILGYCFYNSTGGALVLTIQTKDAAPLPLPLSGSIAAGTTACLNYPPGLLSTGGASLSTTSGGVYYSAQWTH